MDLLPIELINKILEYNKLDEIFKMMRSNKYFYNIIPKLSLWVIDLCH